MPGGRISGGVHQNKSLIIVPLDAKGVDRKTKLDKLGMRASDTAMIFLDEHFHLFHLIGFATILLGVGLATSARPPEIPSE